jgi:hypothetical protein
METIELIKGDSSDIYEFSSKQVSSLTDKWEGSWVVSEALGSAPILEGTLVKNEDVMNEDSLQGEDFRKTFKIFESTELEKVRFEDDVINGQSCIVSGKMYTEGTDVDGNPIEIPSAERYITITLKGVFVPFTREMRVKTDADGIFTYNFNIGKTVKTPTNSFFIFQIMPLQSELLEVGKGYILSIEVREKDANDVIIFRREVLQAKLKITAEGVL